MENRQNKLHEAILSHSDVNRIKNLIVKEQCNPNEFSNASFTLGPNISCLILACTYSNVDVVDILISYGANVNMSNEFEETPLLHAVWNGKSDIVKILIKNNANVNRTDVFGRSPIYFACQKGNTELVNFLIKHHAKLHVVDLAGKTVLSRAVCWGNYNIVKTLLNHNVDIANIDIEEGIEFQQQLIVELLIKEKQVT